MAKTDSWDVNTPRKRAGYLAGFVIAVLILATIIGSNYGTHVEDADPMYGGGTRVEDYRASSIERLQHGVRAFVIIIVPAILGVRKGMAIALDKALHQTRR